MHIAGAIELNKFNHFEYKMWSESIRILLMLYKGKFWEWSTESQPNKHVNYLIVFIF